MARTESFELGGRSVRRIGFGAMQLPGRGVWGPPRDRDAAIRVLRTAVEQGVDHIDTAQFYGPDVANELIHEALHPYPDGLVLVSKVGARRDGEGGWISALSPEQLREDVEANLAALEIERLEVVNLRVPDVGLDRPMDEYLGPMVAMRDEGLIGAVGVSTVTLDHLEAALAITEVAQVQNLYSVANRGSQAVFDVCAQRGIPFVPYFPLGAAWKNDNVLGDATVQAVAARHEITVAQAALAWLLALADNVLLIPGTSSVEHLRENLATAGVSLEESDMAELDRVAAP